MKRGLEAIVAMLAAGLLAGCTVAQGDDPAKYGRIDGAVLGSSMEPLGDVEVVVLETGATARTNDLGGFTFAFVKPGTYVLEAKVPQTAGDRELVIVTATQTTRIILQVETPAPDDGSQTFLRRVMSPLAMPGELCTSCTWTVHVEQATVLLSMDGIWSGRGLDGAEGHVEVETWLDNVLLGVLAVPGSGDLVSTYIPVDLPANSTLEVRTRFAGDILPQPFGMEIQVRAVPPP